MKTLKQLREARVDLITRAQAITEIAKAESRELTDVEAKELDSILGSGDNAGDVGKLDAEIARQERLEKQMASIATQRAVPPTGVGQGVPVNNLFSKQRHGGLKGYQTREDAFRAGCWFASTFLGHQRATEYCQQNGINVQSAMAAGSNSAGGYLVPEEFDNAVVRLVEQYGVFRRNCRVLPMMSETLSFPRRTAGVTSYYVAEVPSSITESSPTLGNAQLVAKVLAVRTLISRDLVEDAIIDVVNLVTQEIALAFANAEDSAGFLGTGASAYGGIVGLQNALAAGSTYTAATGNTAFSTLDNEDFLGMVAMLPTYAVANAKWYISQAGFWSSMARLQAAAGGNTVVDLGSGPVFQYQGFPVVISQVLNSTLTAQTSTSGLAYFGDLSLTATLGNRRGIELQMLNELYAATRQVGVIASQRFDINVHERGTASAAGPMIMLSTPGS